MPGYHNNIRWRRQVALVNRCTIRILNFMTAGIGREDRIAYISPAIYSLSLVIVRQSPETPEI